ncbi:MAG TPA: MFS transporter [Solirubrobacterales bacterium]
MLRVTERNRPWWTLAGSCVGLFVLMLDSTVVVLALPSIQQDLDASNTALAWVQNGYLLAISVLVVTVGRLGDMFGRKRIFNWSLAVFALGSAIAALSQTEGVLVAARIVQGMGGAGLIALSLALACSAFPAERQNTAVGIWAGVSSLALAIGPVAGGALIGAASWRWIFWVNLPIIAIGSLILRAARESRDESSARHLDTPGLAVLSLGLTAIVLALIESSTWGWGSTKTLTLLGAGFALLFVFWLVEHRVAQPIVDFTLFRNRPYLAATAAGFTLVGCYWSVMFFQPQYLQDVLDYSPVETGLLILPITAPMLALSPLTGRFMVRLGARGLLTLSMLAATAGLLLLTRLGADSSYGVLLPGFLLFGISLGLGYAAMSSVAMASMPREKAGIAAGVLAMNRVMAGALGLAVTGAVFAALQRDKLADLLAQRAPGVRGQRGELDGLLAGSSAARRTLHQESHGVFERVEAVFRETFAYALANATWILVGLAAAGAVVSWLLVQSAADSTPAEHKPEHRLGHRRFHF